MKFVRFGGLSSVKQTHYEPNSTGYHNPPKKYGIYAMPYPMADLFLLGATNDPKFGKTCYVRNNNNELLKWDDHITYNHYNETSHTKWTDTLILSSELKSILRKNRIKLGSITFYKDYIIYYKKPKIFCYTGLLWHHLGYLGKPAIDYISINKNWYLSTTTQYEKLLNISYHKIIQHHHHINSELILTRRSLMNTVDCIDVEVFIEKI